MGSADLNAVSEALVTRLSRLGVQNLDTAYCKSIPAHSGV